jgi:hypothetical protein
LQRNFLTFFVIEKQKFGCHFKGIVQWTLPFKKVLWLLSLHQGDFWETFCVWFICTLSTRRTRN